MRNRTAKECGHPFYSNCTCEVGPVEGFTIDQLVGTRRDDEVTVLGELISYELLDWPDE